MPLAITTKPFVALSSALLLLVVGALPAAAAALDAPQQTPPKPARAVAPANTLPMQATPPAAGAQKTFDRNAMRMQLKQIQAAKIARLVAVKLQPSTEMRLTMCRQQRDGLANTLSQCLKTNSDPVNPAPGSPLDAFNKLTNAQLAQKCPGSLQQCLEQVMDEQIAWCKANVCKSQADALASKEAECTQLQELLAQELAQPPALKKNTPPCPALYQSYLAARDAVKNFKCGGGSAWSGLACLSPLMKVIEEEKAALQKLKDNGCI